MGAVTLLGFGGASTRARAAICNGKPTERMIEGPYFTPNSPERQALRDAASIGIPLVVEGTVVGTDCKPIAHALLDVWNADGNGVYDNSGYKLRGHQFTDALGRFRIETVKPGDYGPRFARRTPHLHLKVQRPGGAVVTTQLYFPGESLNEGDELFRDSLLMTVAKSANGSLTGRYDFVLAS